MSVIRRLRATYLGNAILNPFHGAALLGIAALGNGFASSMLGALLVEGVFFVLLPRSELYRRRIDRRREAEEERLLRQSLLQKLDVMRADHREEYVRLESLARAIKARIGDGPGPGRRAIDEHLELDRLLALYIDTAVRHAAGEDMLRLDGVSPPLLPMDDDLAPGRYDGTAAAAAAAANANANASAIEEEEARRQSVLRLRAAAVADNKKRLAELRARLALIADVVALLFERCAVPGDAGIDGADLARIVSNLEDGSAPLAGALAALGDGR